MTKLNSVAIDSVASSMPGNVPSVCVVVLNWNGLADTLECLASLSEADYGNFEVIVVDNGSTDGSIDAISRSYPMVEIIATGKNLGWAGGNNVGIQHALAKKKNYILLLNNDTVVDRACISKLVAAAEQNGPSLMHPTIYYYDEQTVAQLDPTASIPANEKPPIVALDYAYGAALFVDAPIFERVGLIDDRFFLQLEETDFFLRAKACGYGSYCATGARILHKESRAFGGKVTPVKTYYIVRNSLLIMAKHHETNGGYLVGIKKLLWTLNAMVSKERNLESSWRFSDLFWLCTSNRTARAIRFGIIDFIFGNLGALHDSRRAKL